MAEYTIKDVIIDPEDPRLEGVIGKEVYYDNSPSYVLEQAMSGGKASKFMTIDKTSNTKPFKVAEWANGWECIIIKKEDPKPEYVPFYTPDEFVDAYISNLNKRKDIGAVSRLDNFGMWLRWKGDYVAVTYISDQGINENTELMADWQDLFDNYTFLDDTPCGKLKEI